MLVGFSGLLAGYDGSFDFKSGETYPDTVNYTFMRIFGATFGALMVPLAYFTAVEFKLSRNAAVLAAAMVLLGEWLLGRSCMYMCLEAESQETNSYVLEMGVLTFREALDTLKRANLFTT